MRSFGSSDTIFDDMDVLNPNDETYKPSTLPEREQEIDEIHSALRPVTMGSTPINLLIYGETGQGKTVAVDLKTSQLQKWADSEGVDLSVVTVQCKGFDKSYHVMTHLVKALREERLEPGEKLPTGYPKKQLLHMIFDELEAIGGTVVVVLDEIDSIGEDDYILYELPRANLDGVKLSVIGITNDLTFRDNLDADVRSSLGEDEIVFAPYQSDQLRTILARRAAQALRDTGFTCDDCASVDCPHDVEAVFPNFTSNVLDDDVIPLCAAYAAKDTGDAREALRLLFRAARFVDDRGDSVVSVEEVQSAREWIEEKATARGVQTLPTQKLLALMTVTYSAVSGDSPSETSALYDRYKRYCSQVDTDPVSNRRFRDFLNDLADSGLLYREQGRGQGKENTYELAVYDELVVDNLPPTEDRLGGIADSIRQRSSY